MNGINKKIMFVFCANIILFNSALFARKSCRLTVDQSQLGCLNATAQTILNRVRGLKAEIAPCVNITTIKQSEIPYTINEPGTYCLFEDVVNTSNPSPAITIDSDNVVLDLNQKSITSQNQAANAISVKTTLANIEIGNGKILGINGIGINIDNNCHDVCLHNLMISECTAAGIQIDTSDNVYIDAVRITHCNGSSLLATDGAVGLKIDFSSNVTVMNSAFNNNVNFGSKNSFGALVDNCSNCAFASCEFNNNSGAMAYGLTFTNETVSSVVSNCVASANRGDEVYGFCVVNGKYNRFQESIASYQNASSTGNAYGFYALNGAGNVFNECSAIGNTGGTDSASVGIGFSLTGTENRTLINKCISEANDGNGGIGYGIRIDGAWLCDIRENNLMANRGATSGFGIQDTTVGSQSLFIRNVAFNNGNNAATIINNFDVRPAPTNNLLMFPSIIAYLTDLTPLDGALNQMYNVEIIEQQP